MGLGLFDFSSESKSSTTVNTTTNTDSNNRTTNNVRNMSDSGNITVTIPGREDSTTAAAGLSLSSVLPSLVGSLLTVGALAYLLRRK